MLPDYRGGINMARYFGKSLGTESGGLFEPATLKALFIRRFGNDFLVYQQTRFGYTWGRKLIRAQLYWNANFTVDDQRQGRGISLN
jgi:hypothetical protein